MQPRSIHICFTIANWASTRRNVIRWACGVLGVFVLYGAMWGARAEEPAQDKDEDLLRHAQRVGIETVSKGRSEKCERVEKALLYYNDPSRGAARGALWAFGTKGRPSAILEMEVNPSRPVGRQWVHGVVSLAPGPIAVSWDDGTTWQSTKPGLIPRVIPNATAPADSQAARLRQMKELTRRFGVREDAGPVRGKIQLRLMSTAIQRFEDPTSGIHDGAIFAFATGTNPEALLVIESRSVGSAPPLYHYGFARVSGAALMGDLDGKEVWTQAEANPPYRGEVYMNGFHAALTGAE